MRDRAWTGLTDQNLGYHPPNLYRRMGNNGYAPGQQTRVVVLHKTHNAQFLSQPETGTLAIIHQRNKVAAISHKISLIRLHIIL